MAKNEAHRCIDCARAMVYQYDFDPIIGECEIDGQKNVALYPVLCDKFKGMEKMDKEGKRFIRCIEIRKKKIGI